VAVASTFISEIDRDRDGSLSVSEHHAYAERVLATIDLENDGRPLDLTPGATAFAGIDALRHGEGMIRLRASAALPTRSTGSHHVSLRNRYRPDVSVYLANALVPNSERVAVTAQRHDAAQRALTIDYSVRSEPAAATAVLPLAGLAGCLAVLLIRRRIRIGSPQSSVSSDHPVTPAMSFTHDSPPRPSGR
jgi:hypothetical protein